MKQFPPFRLDTINQCLWRHRDNGDDERISLTPKAFGVLRYLVEHAGRLVTQNELLEALWPVTFVQPEVIKSHILDIRAALGTVQRILYSSRLFPGAGTGLSLPSATFQPNQRFLLNQPPGSSLVGTRSWPV